MVIRMTTWYAGTSFLLVLMVASVLYWSMAANMDAEDHRVLRNTATNLSDLLRLSPGTGYAKRILIGPSAPLPERQFIWVRVLMADGRASIETTGMSRRLPVSDFPALLALRPGQELIRSIETRSGLVFQTLSMRLTHQHGQPAVLQVAIDRTAEQQLLMQYRERLMAVLLISLAICSAIGFLIARGGFRPVDQISRAARDIRSSTLHERLDTAGLPAELQSLAESFNVMLARLEGSFQQISRFSADVAHELRTPINNLRGEIEVALGKTRSEAEYRDVLGSALEECARIGRVIQSLLFLARAEIAGENPQLEMLNVHAEIAAIIEFYDPIAVAGGVALTAQVEPSLLAAFDRPLFQQAVGNLLANAIAHTPRSGRIFVRAQRSESNMLQIEVVDTGRGIARAHLPHVFDRFYRADPARSSKGGNFGLGLSIVKSIAALHGGSVSIASESGAGTTVTLRTPLRGA